jgi:hypothetical protein
MWLVLPLMALLFVGLGYLLTEKNAKTTLSGYNTMTELQRQQFDLKSFLRSFRNFHLFLGISLLVIGLLLLLVFGEIPSTLFLVVYPLLAYGFFLVKAQRLNTKQSPKGVIWLAIGIGITAVVVLGLLLRGLSNNEIVVQQDKIQIEGMYGQVIMLADIDSLEITTQLPRLSTRTNGFALGRVKKGYFKTKSGDKVLLYIADADKPCLALRIQNQGWIYYNSTTKPLVEVLADLKNAK